MPKDDPSDSGPVKGFDFAEPRIGADAFCHYDNGQKLPAKIVNVFTGDLANLLVFIDGENSLSGCKIQGLPAFSTAGGWVHWVTSISRGFSPGKYSLVGDVETP